MLSYVSFCSRLTSRFSSVWPSSSERTTFGVIVARKIFDAVIHCPGIVQLVSLNAASSIPRNFNLPRPEQRRPPRGYFNRVNRIAVRFDGARSTIEICSVGLSIPSNVHRHARLYRKNTRLNFTFAFFFAFSTSITRVFAYPPLFPRTVCATKDSFSSRINK